MQKKFVNVTPVSGSNNGSLNVTCGINRDTARSTVINVSGGDIIKTINVNQNMNDKVYPLVYYMFPFTSIETYEVQQEGSFYTIDAYIHITDDVEIVDTQIGLYNLKALKPDIDLANDCTLKQILIDYGGVNPVTFSFNAVGDSLSNKFNGMVVATIPTEYRDNFRQAIQRAIDIKGNYIMFHMLFNNASIVYRINILPA